MWLFWLHFGFGLVAGVEVAPTKKSLYGLYAHSMETAYGENKSNPIKQFRKKIDFSNPIFLSIHFNETAPGTKNNATTVLSIKIGYIQGKSCESGFVCLEKNMMTIPFIRVITD